MLRQNSAAAPFLEAEGIRINFIKDDIVDFGLSVASGDMKYDEFLKYRNNTNQFVLFLYCFGVIPIFFLNILLN